MDSKTPNQDQVRVLLENVERVVTPTQQASSLLLVLRKVATDVAAVRDLLEAKKSEPAPRTGRGKRRYVLDMIESEKALWIKSNQGDANADDEILLGATSALDDLLGLFGCEGGDPLDD